MECQPERQLRHPGAVRGRRDGHADLRGKRPGAFQGNRHHADRFGASIRACPAGYTCTSVKGRCSRSCTPPPRWPTPNWPAERHSAAGHASSQNLRATGDRIEQMLDRSRGWSRSAYLRPGRRDPAPGGRAVRRRPDPGGRAGVRARPGTDRRTGRGRAGGQPAAGPRSPPGLVGPKGGRGAGPGTAVAGAPTAATPSWLESTPKPARCGCDCSATATAARPRRSPCAWRSSRPWWRPPRRSSASRSRSHRRQRQKECRLPSAPSLASTNARPRWSPRERARHRRRRPAVRAPAHPATPAGTAAGGAVRPLRGADWGGAPPSGGSAGPELDVRLSGLLSPLHGERCGRRALPGGAGSLSAVCRPSSCRGRSGNHSRFPSGWPSSS